MYKGFLDWKKNKKAAINLINLKDNKCFQYAIKVTLNHKEIKKDPQKITKIKFFINKYDWEEITFLSEKDNCKKIEESNLTIALNDLYAKKEKIYQLIFQKITETVKNKFFILMIPNGEGWYYLTVKKLSALLRGITSKYHDYFCYVNYLYYFATENKFEPHKKVC